jgi:hypothetical protein
MKEYNAEARHIYNKDEKGFVLGVTGRYNRKEATVAVKDGSREWVTVLICNLFGRYSCIPSY